MNPTDCPLESVRCLSVETGGRPRFMDSVPLRWSWESNRWSYKVLKNIMKVSLYGVTIGWILYLLYDVDASTDASVNPTTLAIYFGAIGVAIYRPFKGFLDRRKSPHQPPADHVSSARIAWLPSFETLLMGGILVALIYATVMLWGYRESASWATNWVALTSPVVEKLALVLPAIDRYAIELTLHGYSDRVAIVRHVFGLLWIWIFMVAVAIAIKSVDSWKTITDRMFKVGIVRIVLAIPALCGLLWLAAQGLPISADGSESHSFYDLIQNNDQSLIINSVLSALCFFVVISFLLFYCIALYYKVFKTTNRKEEVG